MTWSWLIPACLGAAALILLWRHMRRIEPERVEIVHRTLTFPNLPEALDGLRICHVSDLHITKDPRNSAAVAEGLRFVEADLYVLTGDMIHGPGGVEALDRWLGEVSSHMTPALAVYGNAEHKRRIPAARLRQVLETRGIQVLTNETVQLRLRGGSLQVVGLDDPHSGHSRVAVAYAHADPEAWTLVLVHSPEGVLGLDGRRADLILAGHTHGGQILIPGVGWISDNTHNRVGLISGLYTAEDLMVRAGLQHPPQALYVSRGLGTSGFPVRLRCRPELPVLTLRRA